MSKLDIGVGEEFPLEEGTARERGCLRARAYRRHCGHHHHRHGDHDHEGLGQACRTQAPEQSR